MTEANESPPPDAAPSPDASYTRRLLHRWLIEYNPLYLLSAALVLTGAWLGSHGLSQEGSEHGPLGAAIVAELYAACLIGGAALLTRIDQRRPAVMLALLTILYQWDLSLHTERGPYLGAWTSLVWLALFGAKLAALAWAMKIRVSRAAAASLGLAGAGLALLPHAVVALEPRQVGSILAVWIFAMVALRPSAVVTSVEPLTAWGTTVLRRAVAAAWSLSALLVAGHVVFWSSQHDIALSRLLPVIPLLLLRGVRSEARVWAVALGMLAGVLVVDPGAFSLAALLVAAALVLRALSPSPEKVRRRAATRREPPYRGAGAAEPAEEPEIVETIEPMAVGRATQGRLLVGAGFALYLSAWTMAWSGGPWPAHVAGFDVALTVAALAAAWMARERLALTPVLGVVVHFLARSDLLPIPRSLVEWGASAVGLGFALLLGSLVVSYRLRTTPLRR